MRTINAMFWIVLIGFALTEGAFAQSSHLVNVGDSGSFYDPQVVIARQGDIVTFRWTGQFHSITQSSFTAPCTPLQGGFDSGVTGNPPQQNPTPEWNLTITDDTSPIWFFCKVTHPVSHCTAGMVGAINAVLSGTNESFDVFVQTAKVNATVPTLSSGLPPALSGVGAFATAVPISINNVTNTSTTASPSSSSTTSSTSTTAAIQTQTAASSGSGLTSEAKGGIAGGIVGTAVVVILLALLFMSYQRGRRYRKEAREARTLRSQSSRDMSHTDRQGPLFTSNHYDSSSRIPAQMGQFQRSQGTASIAESLERDSTAGPSINIQELAAEIAKNIRQDVIAEERGRPPYEGTGLEAVPEQTIANAVSRAESARAESTRTGVRQLPNPPPTTTPRRAADTISVDTLPAYISGHPR